MDKKGMTWQEVIYALLAAIIILFLFTAWGGPIVKLVQDIGVKLSIISPEPDTPDTYAICDPLKTVIVTVEKPEHEDPNAFFTYGWNGVATEADTDEIILRFSPPLDQVIEPKDLMRVYVSKNLWMRPTGEEEWKEFEGELHSYFSVAGGKSSIGIQGIPQDYVLIELTDEPVSGTRRICKSQRQVSMEVDR